MRFWLGPGCSGDRMQLGMDDLTLEAQIPICWVPVLKSLYKFILSTTHGPTIWVSGLLGLF